MVGKFKRCATLRFVVRTGMITYQSQMRKKYIMAVTKFKLIYGQGITARSRLLIFIKIPKKLHRFFEICIPIYKKHLKLWKFEDFEGTLLFFLYKNVTYTAFII